MTFRELSAYFQKLESTSSRLVMTETLSRLFREAKTGEIGKLCYLLQGRVVPLYEAVEFGVADKFMIRAIAKAADVPDAQVLKEFKAAGDLGIAAEKIKSSHSLKAARNRQNIKVNEVHEKLYQIAKTGGAGSQEKKIEMLAELIRTADPLSSRYLARIPVGKLRLGFSEMTILDGLSWMTAGDKSRRIELENAYNARPDIGFIAETLKAGGIAALKKARVTVGVPVLAALSQRLSGAQEMIRKMGEVCVEPKYDGVRCQIHFSKLPNAKFRVQSYSRNLENTTDMWPELSSIGRQIRADAVILDSEAVGIDPETGRTIPFQETTTRKRKHDIDLFSSQVPVRFYVFDILYKDGSELIKKPLRDRRKILEGTVRPGETLVVTPHIITKSVRSLTGFHHVQLKAGFEGAMVKKWDSQYEPGRRGYNWVKFKETEGKTGKLTDTIDSVVMGYYLGKGKRTGFGIGAFLAGIRSGDGFVTVTKVGTGVSDELWKELHRRIGAFRSHVQPKHYRKVPKQLVPDVWAEPRLVVEIAGDDLTRSPLHGAGFAVRFPRLVRIRTDKSPHQATSVDEVARMYRNQGNGNR